MKTRNWPTIIKNFVFLVLFQVAKFVQFHLFQLEIRLFAHELSLCSSLFSEYFLIFVFDTFCVLNMIVPTLIRYHTLNFIFQVYQKKNWHC